MWPKTLAVLAVAALAGTTPSLTAGGALLKSRPTLATQARQLATHGGIRSSRYADATSRMKQLSRQLVVQRFRAAGSDAVRWAQCVVERESGWNPGAVNSYSGAAGLFQFLGHPQFSRWRILHDPAYAVDAAWSLSHAARDRSPWYGGGYSC